MRRTFAVVLFGFSLLITGQALAEICGTLVPGGRTCCEYDNIVTYGGTGGDGPTFFNGYVVSSGVGRAGPFPDGAYQYLTSSPKQCEIDARNKSQSMAYEKGCRLGTSFGSNVGTPVLINALTDTFEQSWLHVTYGLFWQPPYNRVPCLTTRGRARYVPAPPVICPIDPLLPKPTDECSQTLERTFGVIPPGDLTCPRAAVMESATGEPCFKRKVQALGIAYTAPTSTYRSAGYQNHIADVWGAWGKHSLPMALDVYQACSTKRAVVLAELNGPPAPGHRLVYPPSGNSHLGDAFDVDSNVTVFLRYAVPNIQTYLDTAATGDAACKLTWGGTYDYPDNVHFVTK